MKLLPRPRYSSGILAYALSILVMLLAASSLHAQLPPPLAVYDSATGTGLPTSQGWTASLSGTGTGSLITDLGAPAWQANGSGGRAQWQVVPTSTNNSDATTFGWTMTTVCRVVSGGYITNYYSNGTKRFLPILSINASGSLIAQLEGGGTFTLVSTAGSAAYHTYKLTYSPATGMATFNFDGTNIATWAGSASSQNLITFGNGSSTTHGVANYDNVTFQILGSGSSAVFSKNVFVGGAEGANGKPFYRIPTLICAPNGSLLAFAEGRPTTGDPGSGSAINISYKRSTDRGRNWSTIQVLASSASFSYSDPRVFVDSLHGKVFLFYTQWPLSAGLASVPQGTGSNSSVLFCRTSTDNGLTWSAAVNLNSALKNPSWYVLSAVVGVGVQLDRQTVAQGSANGRLIFPALVKDASAAYRNVSVYSDDFGATWHVGTSMTPVTGPTEANLTELLDGRLLLSSRNDGAGTATRYHFLSSNGGQSWTSTGLGGIAVSKVDCGLLYYDKRNASDTNRVLISAPLGTPVGSGTGRSNLGVWKSTNEGSTFPTYKQLITGYSAYSQLIRLDDSTVGIIFEATSATQIVFLNCTVDIL